MFWLRPVTALASCAVLMAWMGAGVSAAPGQDIHAGIAADDIRPPLPRYMTAEEALLPLPVPSRDDYLQRTPPTGVVYTPAEYEPMDGMLIAWEGYTSILTTMTVHTTNNDPPATVWVVVDSSSEQSSAYSALNSAGADMSHVQFIIRTTDTVWIRDYGPRFIFEDGQRAIVDHTYNRPLRPNDDAFNDYLAALWGIPQYDLPLTHGGGNYHSFSNGDAFMSSLITAENPGYTAQQIIDLYEEYQNVDLTIYTGFPTSFDSTRHIDMWLMELGDNKVLVGQYASSTGQPYTITENAVADLTARGYTVYRTPGWNSGGTHYTYTNSVILNDQVLISQFGSPYTSQDATALSVYQAAMPGYEIIQVYNGDIISAAGAMHCIMMHVPAYAPEPIPQVHVTDPDGGEFWYVGHPYSITWVATDDVGVTGIDIYYSIDGGATYPYTIATGEPNDGVFPWTVPNTTSAQGRVKVVAWDADLHSGEDVSDADFTIAPPVPTVTVQAPNGGEAWHIGETHDITWTATDDLGVTAIDIYYSVDGGASYPHTVAVGEANDGVFHWTIPQAISEHCRVRVVAWDADSNSGEDTSNADFVISLGPEIIYAFPMDTNPGWAAQGSWAFGPPLGGGSHSQDPTSGYTGANVCGYNLNGDYTNGMSAKYLTTGALNCSLVGNVQLKFRRWLGVERTDRARIEASTNGADWTLVWENPTGSHISEASWTLQQYDISAVADGQATVYLRWVMGLTDTGVTYPGWNIDDVEIWGTQEYLAGDCNCDNVLNIADADAFVLALTDPAEYGNQYPGCTRGDMDGSGTVDGADIQLFVDALLP